MPVDDVETENQRLVREAQQKRDAETTAARGKASEQSQPVSQQSLMQYLQMVE